MTRRSPPPFADAGVKAVFDAYPPARRRELLLLRALILATAAQLPQVGPLTETLKWGQPAYLPARPRTGTTIRIDALKPPRDGTALYIHCQTTLAAQFRAVYPGLFRLEGDRALLFAPGEAPPRDALAHCIALALTYHLAPVTTSAARTGRASARYSRRTA